MKDVTYENIKSHKKPRLHLLSEKYSFGKTKVHLLSEKYIFGKTKVRGAKQTLPCLFRVKSVFYLPRTNENFKTCIPVWFEQLKELIQFWNTLVNVLIYGHCRKNVKYHVRWKLLHVAIQLFYSKIFTLNSCTFSIFYALEKTN